MPAVAGRQRPKALEAAETKEPAPRRRTFWLILSDSQTFLCNHRFLHEKNFDWKD
jgi:hypothetical protein